MGLFEKFTETVIVKSSNELEKQIVALKKLQEKYPNNEKVEKQLKLCELGLYGENKIEYELKNANIGMYVLRDVNLKYEDMTAQIDYMIITPAYIYFVECKNLVGNITINNRGEFVREYTYKGKKIKEGIYSPIRQTERHLEIFKKIRTQRRNSLIDRIFRELGEKRFKPLVVIANPKSILNIKDAPKEIKDKVIRADSLISYIKKDIQSTDKDLLWNKETMYTNALSIMQNYNQKIEKNYEEELEGRLERSTKEKQIQPLDVSNDNNEKLRAELIAFRKNRAKEKNVPPYYIFNNEELELLLKYKPRSIEKLREENILADVKIRLHGKGIVEIINNQ